MIFNNSLLCNKTLEQCCKDKFGCDGIFCLNLRLKYLSCDDVEGFKGSERISLVDAVRLSDKKDGKFILVEIKNSPIKNLTPCDVKKQLESSIKYLKKEYYDSLLNGVKFFLALSPQKNKNTDTKNLKEKIKLYRFSMFFNKNYKFSVDGTHII